MSDLNPEVRKLGNGKIEMTWTPDLTCFGYRFYRDGVAVSKGTNVAQGVTTFAKETDGKSHEYGIARALEGQPEVVSFPSAPPSQGTIPQFEVTITPNWVAPQDRDSNYNAIWAIFNSPSIPWRSPDSNKTTGQRYLLLDPRAQDADGRPGQDEWWFIIERAWPASFDPMNHGDWGREVNFHNVAGDVGWSSGNGVSALALDWLKNYGGKAPQISLEQAGHGSMWPAATLPVPTRDAMHTYVLHFIAGRTDGTTVRPGALTVWADGDPHPICDLKNINTIQRYADVTQKWMQLWEGDYTGNLQKPATTRFAATRAGKTLELAVADRPKYATSIGENSVYRGSGANFGPPELKQLAPWDVSKSKIPVLA